MMFCYSQIWMMWDRHRPHNHMEQWQALNLSTVVEDPLSSLAIPPTWSEDKEIIYIQSHSYILDFLRICLKFSHFRINIYCSKPGVSYIVTGIIRRLMPMLVNEFSNWLSEARDAA